ncbi:MAG: hypothetical protein ACFFDC_12520 [Promethearchaeota archaeon]
MKKILIIFLLLFTLISLSGCTVPIMNFEYAGDQTPINLYMGSYNGVIFDFKLSVGSITLETNPTTENFSVTNKISIREGSNAQLEEAEEVSYEFTFGMKHQFRFDSKDETGDVDYKYDIVVKVPTKSRLEINFKVTTGDISLTISDPTIVITSLDLVSTTGSLTVALEDVGFDDPTVKIDTTTGSLDLTLTSLNYTMAVTWDASTTTGDINLTISAADAPSSPSRVYTFNLAITTGDLTVTTTLHADYGLQAAASVATGTISLPGGGESYTSSNYASAAQKYDFDLSVSTGDITVTV